MNLSEEVKAMIWIKASERMPEIELEKFDQIDITYRDIYGTISVQTFTEKFKPVAGNVFYEWLEEIPLSELLSKAGYVKKEESVTIESLTPDLIDRRLITICNVEETFLHLSAKHTAEFLLEKYRIESLPSPPQNKEQ